MINDVIRDLTTPIKPFIDNNAVAIYLCEEITIEIREPAFPRVRKVNIGEFAAAHLIHFAAVLFDPRQVPQSRLTLNRYNRNVARSTAVGIRTYSNYNLLSGRFFEERIHVLRRPHLA